MPTQILAQSDVGIELYHSASLTSQFTKLIDVTAVPATGAAQAKLEATVLSSPKKQYIPDREDLPDLEFSFNMTAANYEAVEAVVNTAHYFLIVYGEGNGALIYGEANVWADAAGRGTVLGGKMNVVPESIEYKTVAEVTALLSS